MHRGDRQKSLKAGGNPLPADHQSTIFLLKPGNRALGLASWHDLFDWSATVFLRLPSPLGHLGSATTLAKLLPEGFGIIAFTVAMTLRRLRGRPHFPVWTLHRMRQGLVLRDSSTRP